MNHYERIVSYIHQYQGGAKGANVGYAKIEKRGEDCRIQVQLRNGHASRNPQIYLFRQLEGGIRSVPMGEMSMSGNEIYFKGSTAVGKLFGADLSLEEVDGLLIYLNRDYYFATSWKNDSIYLGNWSPEEQGGERAVSEHSAEEGKGIGGEMTIGGDSSRVEDISGEKGEHSEGFSQTAEITDGEEQGAMPTAGKSDVQDLVEGREEQQQEKDERPEKDAAVMSEGVNGGSREVMTEKGEREDEEQKKERGVGEGSVEAAGTSQLQMQAICGVCPFKRQNVDYGKRILLSFPTMRPFPEEKGSECVRLELQDIGCLPMKYWSLSGNRFLLHGYYCYRHLIFCQKGMGKYMLGVPGIYSDREQKNALRFGFHSFQSIGEFGKQQGAFGYWLMELM